MSCDQCCVRRSCDVSRDMSCDLSGDWPHDEACDCAHDFECTWLEAKNIIGCHDTCDSPATPITPATRRHSPSPEAPHICHNSEDSYNDHKDPSHPLYQYNYREAYRQHILQTSKDRAAIEALEDTILVPWNMPATSPLSLEEAIREGSVWEAAPPEDTHCPLLPSDDDAALPPGGHHIPGGFDLNVITPLGHSAVDQQLLEDCLRMY